MCTQINIHIKMFNLSFMARKYMESSDQHCKDNTQNSMTELGQNE